MVINVITFVLWTRQTLKPESKFVSFDVDINSCTRQTLHGDSKDGVHKAGHYHLTEFVDWLDSCAQEIDHYVIVVSVHGRHHTNASRCAARQHLGKAGHHSWHDTSSTQTVLALIFQLMFNDSLVISAGVLSQSSQQTNDVR